ncbi:hypothetical protein GCM10027535_37980 [Mycolicibacterium hippocampi]|uniref:Uncharacterized protein n=1 Tax=Mycolicibacterium hippocampi TaxID=659824 RepID=A0A7I9ZMI5_9MYCO|nr:hypothetical protein MHIP_25560 [Mycolicibacterium hippocampi]
MARADLHLLHRADIHAGDPDPVPSPQTAGIGEFAVVARLSENYRIAGEALPYRRNEQDEGDGHDAGADPVGWFKHSH